MSTIAREFTKEQLQQIIETDHVQCGEASALARIALASLEAEPVISHLGSKNALDAIAAFIKSNRNPTLKDYNEVSERLFQDNCHGLSNHVIEYIKQIGEELEELRSTQDTAPPAPEFYKIGDATMRHIFTPTGITDVSDMQAVFDQIETVLAGMWQPATVSVPDEYVAAVPTPTNLGYEAGWNACRAALLQSFGNSEQLEPVTTANKLPGCWVACSERMPDDEEDVLCFGQYGDNDIDEERYQFMGWLSSKGIKRVWRVSDGDSQNRRARVTHWMPLPAAPQQRG